MIKKLFSIFFLFTASFCFSISNEASGNFKRIWQNYPLECPGHSIEELNDLINLESTSEVDKMHYLVLRAMINKMGGELEEFHKDCVLILELKKNSIECDEEFCYFYRYSEIANYFSEII